MIVTIVGVVILGLWLVVCYSLCRVSSMQSRAEEENARRRAMGDEQK